MAGVSRDRIEAVGFYVLVTAAVVMAVAVTRREFFASESVPPTIAMDYGPPQYQEGWEQIAQSGIRIGPASAPIQIVEFSDLECPFCRRFHDTFDAARRHWADTVALIFVHFPLTAHRFAEPAARAAECADLQGSFESFISLVFRKQDSLGLKSWNGYAKDAGVPDIEKFKRCVDSGLAFPRIAAGRATGERISVSGTPTVLVNGWRFRGTPSDSLLSQIVIDLLAGRTPSGSPSRPRGASTAPDD